MAPPAYETVAVFASVAEAEMARSQLVASGIAAHLGNAQTIGVLPMHTLALGGVRVLVPAEDEARAREILGPLDGPDEDDPGELDAAGDRDSPTMPAALVATAEGDAWMRRAAAAAAFGALLVPVVLNLFSIAVLVRHGAGPLSRQGRRHRTIALVANAAGVASLMLLYDMCSAHAIR